MAPKKDDKETVQQNSILTAAHKSYEKGLTSYAFFKLRDRVVCEDLVQETFLKTWNYLLKGGKVGTMKAFLYHVLNHLIVDEYRKRKPTSLDALLEKGFEPTAANFERVFNVLDGKAALVVIDRLPEMYKKVMRMRYVQEMSLSEISSITGRTKNTIAVQLHRGLQKLKLLWDPLDTSLPSMPFVDNKTET